MPADRATAALAISTAAIVPAIYGAALPNLADTRGQVDERGHILAAEQYAAVIAGAVVLGIAGVTGSPEVALVGIIAVIGYSSAYAIARKATP